jgi:hypothetical protein
MPDTLEQLLTAQILQIAKPLIDQAVAKALANQNPPATNKPLNLLSLAAELEISKNTAWAISQQYPEHFFRVGRKIYISPESFAQLRQLARGGKITTKTMSVETRRRLHSK